MKKYINIILGILLTLITILLIISLFFYNKTFINKVITKNNISDIVYKEIDSSIDEEFELDKDLLNLDIKRYIDNGYYLNVNNKIKVNDELKYEDIYSKNIKLFNKYKVNNIKSTVYFLTYLVLIITGILFIKTKFKHNIDLILLISGVVDIIIYGFIYLLNNFNSAEVIIANTLLHILLFIGCLFVCVSILLLNEKRIRKLFNCK